MNSAHEVASTAQREPNEWVVWLKADPSIRVEVLEREWAYARVLGACEISARIGRAVFFEELEAAHADLVANCFFSLDFERVRRALDGR